LLGNSGLRIEGSNPCSTNKIKVHNAGLAVLQ
jgi:hypothetical protein